MNFDIVFQTHFVVVAGSHAYGTNTSESDLDIRGWAIPPKEIIFSYIKNFEQHDTKQELEKHPFRNDIQQYVQVNNLTCKSNLTDMVDSTIYNLKKFMFLAADCNPNIIDLLFTKDSEIIFCDYWGEELLEHRTKFLSERARYSFAGYAISQLKRIHTHRRWHLNPLVKKPEREDFGLPEKSLISPDQLKAAQTLIDKQVRLWMLDDVEIDGNVLDLIKDDLKSIISNILKIKEEETTQKIDYAAGKNYGMTDEYLDVLQREKKYKTALNDFNSYQTWLANRNPARAELENKFGYDVKNAVHLCRLLVEAEEILYKGTLTLKQPEHVEFFKAVRRGVWAFEKLLDWSTEKMSIVADKNIKCVVPKKVNVEKLDTLYQELVISSLEDDRIVAENFS